MNDLEFRRTCYVNPHDSSEGFLQKCRDDPLAARFAREMAALESKLEATFRVPVPPRLEDRVVQRNTPEPVSFSQLLAAMAVSLLVGIMIAMGLVCG